jgi:DNA gyrase subunit A
MPTASIEDVPLHLAASERYLNYALSVITSRALPDVRDGLKPVQRRILYTMFNEMSLHPQGRYRKCAAVVGEVMGKFHPHGDASIYDAMVRMAQDFSLRHPLVDGQGNFGSLDGDPPAAMRYTECKLRQLAEDLLQEIKKETVDFQPNYDGQRQEPKVLPAQFPQLLVNGSEGIAVGMATRIPPHNLGEVLQAAIRLIDNDLSVAELLRTIKGPDFPTGGEIIADKGVIREIYETGSGTVRLRGTFKEEKDGRRRQIIVDSIPYGQNKSKLIERIGEHVRSKKLPQVVDLRDESTEDVRIVLDLKSNASTEAVMAYLFKHTPLQTTWSVNLTALIPTESGVPAPRRLDLKEILNHWLTFRFETVRRRFEHDLRLLRDRIHILEGFALIFDLLDEAIRIIRESEGRRDAAESLMDRFDLTEVQTDAILDLRLYRLARLQILAIREELAEKREEAATIETILASEARLWDVVKNELAELRKVYMEPRRTLIGNAEDAELEYDEDAYIVKEDTYVVVTRDGWMKRQSSFSDVSKIRVRDADEIGWLFKAHTRSTVTVFSSLGSAYVIRVDDVPSTTGYGEPLQRHFNFGDGEKVVGVVSHDARHRPVVQESLPLNDDDPPPPWAVAMTEGGRVLRVPLSAHEEISTKSGRRFARLDDDDAVLAVYTCDGTEFCAAASHGGRAIVFPVAEAPILARSGKGSMGIKLRDDDRLLAFELARNSLEGPEVVTSLGRTLVVRERKFGVSKRGARGRIVLKRGSIDTWNRLPSLNLGVPDTPEDDPTEEVQQTGGDA